MSSWFSNNSEAFAWKYVYILVDSHEQITPVSKGVNNMSYNFSMRNVIIGDIIA